MSTLTGPWLEHECRESFWRLVDKAPSDPHFYNGAIGWEWRGLKNKQGYGYFIHPVGGWILGAHRLTYMYEMLEIPDGHDLDHLCRVRDCVSPLHLEPVTHKENLARRDNARSLAQRIRPSKSNSGLRSAFAKRR